MNKLGVLIAYAFLVSVEVLPAKSQESKMPVQQRVEFEVASIKPAGSQGGIGCHVYPGGRVACHHSTLELLIEYAFDVQRFQVSGGPAWISAVREYWYDIDAVPPSGSKSAIENPSTSKAPLNHEQREMLQSLLMDRFHLRFHRETREGPVYLLTLGKRALKLKEAKHDSEFEWIGSVAGAAVNGDGLAGKNISMPVMAQRLSLYLGKPVFDQTGLKGFFDFEHKYDSDEAHPDVTSCIITSLQALGLKLKPSRGPVETIVVDGAEKPSAN